MKRSEFKVGKRVKLAEDFRSKTHFKWGRQDIPKGTTGIIDSIEEVSIRVKFDNPEYAKWQISFGYAEQMLECC